VGGSDDPRPALLGCSVRLSDMSDPAAPGVEETLWLTEEQQCAWRSLAAVLQLLPVALDRQLQDEAGVSHTYYMILAMLSEAPEHQMRMSQLARLVSASQSRLTHAVNRLEERGWVARCPSPEDKRGQVASLTSQGFEVLVTMAPGHVREVRRRIFDVLTPQQATELGRILDIVNEGLRRDC
jgi:DNA-binding MarR family transcriptional regulator